MSGRGSFPQDQRNHTRGRHGGLLFHHRLGRLVRGRHGESLPPHGRAWDHQYLQLRRREPAHLENVFRFHTRGLLLLRRIERHGERAELYAGQRQGAADAHVGGRRLGDHGDRLRSGGPAGRFLAVHAVQFPEREAGSHGTVSCAVGFPHARYISGSTILSTSMGQASTAFASTE